MGVVPSPELEAIVDERGDIVVPGALVSEFVDAAPGDHVWVRIVPGRRPRKNMYGHLAERPLNLDEQELATARESMWGHFGTDDGT